MIESWIIPCNIRVYDVSEHFLHKDTIVWRNAFTIKKGDIAFLYVGQPYSEIRYKCSVLSDDVSEEILSNNSYAIPKRTYKNYFSKKDKYIILQLEKEYPKGTFPLVELREQGLGQVQLQSRLSRQLKKYIASVEKAVFHEETRWQGGDVDA